MSRKPSSSAEGGDEIALTATISTSKAPRISLSLDNPQLSEMDPESIPIFLRKYDQYANEVTSRAHQLESDTASTKSVRPVNLKFCVYVKCLESSIALYFILDVTDYADSLDEKIRELF